MILKASRKFLLFDSRHKNARRETKDTSLLAFFYWNWNVAVAWLYGVDGVLSKSNVYAVPPDGITKNTSPVEPVEPAAKLSGNVVSVVGVDVVFPDFNRT